MIGLVTPLIARLGRRAALYGALALAIISALGIAMRQGRKAAEAIYAIRRADARIRSMQTAKELRHDIQSSDRPKLERRADRWMRD
jgi:hypothetical protein